MGQPVNVAERWRIENRRHVMVEFTIERIEKNESGELLAYGVLDNGKPISFTVAALSRGMRGARLVRHADGHEPYRPKVSERPDESDLRTASDFRRTSGPRGLTKASEKMELAYKMRHDQGLPVAEVAKHFGISANRLAAWCAQAREARADRKYLGSGT